MPIIKNVFRRKKSSDAADNEGAAVDGDNAFDDENRVQVSQDAEGLEDQNGTETVWTPEFVVAGESKNPVTSSDRESSPAEGLTRPRSSSKLSRKSRRTLRVDAIEELHVHQETEKIPHSQAQSKRGALNSHVTPEPEKVNEEDEGFGFEIEIAIPAEPAREVLRRSSSRERGRRSRSSSRDAMRKVRERSMQRRTERPTKENPDSSQNGDGMASSMHSAINQDTSNGNANSQDEIKPTEKKSRSPRLGTRSRSSERPLASKTATVGHEVRTDVGGSLEGSQDQAVDPAKSTPSSLNRARGSSREGRRPRREKESTEQVNVESAKPSTPDSHQIEKRSPYRSSSRDIMRSKRSDSKERNRRSRADSKERPMSTRSSSKDGRGHGRSRSKDGLSSRVLRCYSEKGEENTDSVQRRPSTEESPSHNEEISPMNKPVPRRNSREDIVSLKSQNAMSEDHEKKTRIPRRNSREDALRQQTLERTEGKHESTSQDETHNGRGAMHQQTNQEADGDAPKHKSIRHMVRPNSREDESPSKGSQQTAEEMPHKGGSPSRAMRQRSRERRSRRPRVQSSDEKTEKEPNVETTVQDSAVLLKKVDEERKETEMKESVEMSTPRALPNVIIHEEVERQQLEARKGFGRVARNTEVSPAMALLNHLGSSDTVVPANQLHIEESPSVPAEVLDEHSVKILDDIKEEITDLREEGNESMIEPASQQNETLKATETNDETKIDSATVEMQSITASTSIDHVIQQNVEKETVAEELDAIGKTESLNEITNRRNNRKDMTRTKRRSTTGVQGDQSKDSNPANDLLGFLGSNYDDLFTKNEESSTPKASDPFSVDQPANSIDFFQAINFTGFEHQSGGDDYDRIEKLVDSLDNDAMKGEGKPLPPPSVAPVDEFAKQKARMARRLARQKKAAGDKDDDDEAPPSSTLCPPSLAGDMPKLMHKSSVRKPKKEAREPSARGVSRCHSDDGSALTSMSNAQDQPSTKSTSGSRPKIRRATSGDNLGDHVCEQSLAPPSLAPPSLAPRSRMAPKSPEKEEEMPRKVTRREVRKATKFASLDEDDDDEDSVGIIMATTSPAEVPKRKGMLSKAQSAVNILEKTTRRVVKKATSTKNLFA